MSPRDKRIGRQCRDSRKGRQGACSPVVTSESWSETGREEGTKRSKLVKSEANVGVVGDFEGLESRGDLRRRRPAPDREGQLFTGSARKEAPS